jgi:hypothetical protein
VNEAIRQLEALQDTRRLTFAQAQALAALREMQRNSTEYVTQAAEVYATEARVNQRAVDIRQSLIESNDSIRQSTIDLNTAYAETQSTITSIINNQALSADEKAAQLAQVQSEARAQASRFRARLEQIRREQLQTGAAEQEVDRAIAATDFAQMVSRLEAVADNNVAGLSPDTATALRGSLRRRIELLERRRGNARTARSSVEAQIALIDEQEALERQLYEAENATQTDTEDFRQGLLDLEQKFALMREDVATRSAQAAGRVVDRVGRLAAEYARQDANEARRAVDRLIDRAENDTSTLEEIEQSREAFSDALAEYRDAEIARFIAEFRASPAADEPGGLELFQRRYSEFVENLDAQLTETARTFIDAYTEKLDRIVELSVNLANRQPLGQSLDQIRAAYAQQSDAAEAIIRSLPGNLARQAAEVDADVFRARAEVERNFVDAVDRATSAFYDGVTHSADRFVSRFEAAARSLDNRFNRGRVTDIDRRIAGDRVSEARESTLPGIVEAAQQREAAFLDIVTNRARLAEAAIRDYNEALERAGGNEQDPAVLAALERKTEATERLAEATAAAEAATDDLTQAQNELVAATAQHDPASLADQFKAATQQWLENSGALLSASQQFSQGIGSVYSATRDGMKGLIKDVVTGTKSIEDAFRDMGISILESMLDLAAEMLANAAIKWMLETLMSTFGGGYSTSSTGTPVPKGASGGLVGAAGLMTGSSTILRRMIGGGGNPNRDSMLAFVQPGEFLMRQSAVNFIGEDRLAALNAMGNRRISSSGPVGAIGAVPRDTVNVYVVSPDQKPASLSKKDVLVIVSEDMATGGQTKKLVKAIQTGQV